MTDEEAIHVADVSEGVGADDTATPGTPVELPVVDVLTGRSFITGKSGSGKSNTASVVIENLLAEGFPVMIVDTDGEYYGLKESFEILHVGADDECDIVVSPEHAEKIASLALEQNVPIILDVSGYIDESVANELLLNVVKQLFAKEKKLKKPFLLVVEECHEYIPEGGGMDETGRMLIKVGKRGRKHGLGIVGISQRPADVKKDFITQCDWLCWHRLTWDNDTSVVGRILGSTYADAIEELDDGEAFLMSDWNESIRRIQFHRKRTFDAGATPGLDDFERPELKSVSGELVSELESISDEKARHESALADLRQELDEKRVRINQLERELSEARDLSSMADQFAQALLQKAEAPYRSGSGRNRSKTTAEANSKLAESMETTPEPGTDSDAESVHPSAVKPTSERVGDTVTPKSGGIPKEDATRDVTDNAGQEPSVDTPTETERAPSPGSKSTSPPPDGQSVQTGGADDVSEPVTVADVAEEALRMDETLEFGTREAVIEELRDRIESLPSLSLGMLRHYRREGVSDPIAAHIDAGGDGQSGKAYSRHRPIRKAGLIRHAGRGHYAYAVPDLIRDAYANHLDDETIHAMVREVEVTFVPAAERSYPPDADPAVVSDDSERPDEVDSNVDPPSSGEPKSAADFSPSAEPLSFSESSGVADLGGVVNEVSSTAALGVDAADVEPNATPTSATAEGLSRAAKRLAARATLSTGYREDDEGDTVE